MRKRNELQNETSCINRAGDDEMVFVLLGRDPVAPMVIRIWSMLRVLIGKNLKYDRQITEANTCADIMERERNYYGAKN